MSTFGTKFKIITYGYIRLYCRSQQLFPSELLLIIFEFMRCNDLWSKKHSNKGFRIDALAQCLTVMDKKQDSFTAFGKRVVCSGSFKWTVKIKKIVHNAFNQSPFIGVIEDSAKNLKKYKKSWNWHKCGYQIGGDGFYACMNPNRSETKKLRKGKIGFNRSGNEIDIILDLSDCTIRYVINGKDKGILFKNIKQTKYRFAISVHECYESQFEFL